MHVPLGPPLVGFVLLLVAIPLDFGFFDVFLQVLKYRVMDCFEVV